jgi:hypothetical protein
MKQANRRRSNVKKGLPESIPVQSRGHLPDGEFLAGWLNSDGWGHPVEAQKRLTSLLLELGAVREKSRAGLEIGSPELGAVNELLKEYPWVLQLRSVHPSRTAKRSRLIFVNRPAVPIEQGHTWLGMLLDLMSSGMLDRLRTCAHCGCWFYARLPKAKYHSTSCRQANFRSTAEFQEENKKYQRNYYREWLSPVTGKYAKAAKRRKKENQRGKKR